MSKYLFTIISAVYNSEKYIDELMESLLNQTIGFENIQVILVNDGSKDNSLSVCKKYEKLYGDNVLVIDKENGGVSSARNTGLLHAEGKYLNFIDSDDKFSLDTLEKVYNYFEKYQDKTDVVNIPFEYFDGATGGRDHAQNKKFENGSRLVDLSVEYKLPIMNVAFSFVKRTACENLTFDTSLSLGEDIKFINTILLKKRTVALLSEGKYWYRQHSDGSPSLISSKLLSPNYYVPQLESLTLWAYEYSMSTYGDYPLFLQYTIANEFKEKIKPNNRAKAVLNDDITKYRELVDKAMSTFSDEIIIDLEYLEPEYKAFWLSKKHGCLPYAEFYDNESVYLYKNETALRYGGHAVFDRIELDGKSILISGSIYSLPFINDNKLSLYIKAYNKLYELTLQNNSDHIRYFDDEIIFYKSFFNVSIPLENTIDTDFSVLYGTDKLSTVKDVEFAIFSPISTEPGGEIYIENDIALYPSKNGFSIRKKTKKELKTEYKSHLKYLLKSYKKHFLVRIIIDLLKKFKKKEIWLFSDRFDMAKDNGEALFEYANKNKPANVKPYFVISKSSPDYKRIKSLGKTVKLHSIKHKILFLLCDKNISSHLDYEILLPIDYNFYRDYISKKDIVFLQHGVTKDDIHAVYSKYKQNISLFICASDMERASILQNQGYGLSENEVKVTGFARFDYLESKDEKIIAIMPTWRKYLVRDLNNNGKWNYASDLEKTEFVRFYKELLSSERLVETAKKCGYKIHYVPHPNVMPLTDMLDVNPYISVISNPVYRDVFSHSSLMLTDYSSTAFDFAYMKKPVVYAHFDSKLFFDSHTYKKGYFSYENDGFGEVVYDVESTISILIEYMVNECQPKDIYLKRMDKFFKYSDKNNRERVLSAILDRSNTQSKKEPIPVVLATNEAFAPFSAVAINSLLKNASKSFFYDIYILNTNLSKKTINKLEQKSHYYSVKCVDVSEYILPYAKSLQKNSTYITEETYFRLVIPSILPDYKKAIYIDSDLILLDDISRLFMVELQEYLVAGVKNPLHQKMQAHVESLGLNPDSYINAGVLVMNLERMRCVGFEDKCFELLQSRNLKLMDQDAINLVCQSGIKYLDMGWNYGWHYERLNREPNKELHLLKTEKRIYKKASKSIKIIHYTGDIKPWNDPNYRFGEIFWKYAKNSNFYDEILEKAQRLPTRKSLILNKIKHAILYPFGK